MLGSLENPTLPPENVGTVPMTVRGNNAMGAGDQQGRPDEQIGHYIAGFVDGEGSFHVAVQRNPTTRLKWQVIPEFHISQNDGNQHVLALIRDVLGGGDMLLVREDGSGRTSGVPVVLPRARAG